MKLVSIICLACGNNVNSCKTGAKESGMCCISLF